MEELTTTTSLSHPRAQTPVSVHRGTKVQRTAARRTVGWRRHGGFHRRRPRKEGEATRSGLAVPLGDWCILALIGYVQRPDTFIVNRGFQCIECEIIRIGRRTASCNGLVLPW